MIGHRAYHWTVEYTKRKRSNGGKSQGEQYCRRRSSGISSAKAVWEGVTCYLFPATVNDVLSFVATRSRDGSRLAFDHFSASVADGSCELPETKALAGFSRRFRERILSGIAPKNLNSRLRKHGLVLEENFARESNERTYFKEYGRNRPVVRPFPFRGRKGGKTAIHRRARTAVV